MNLDPPQHGKYRHLLNGWFSPAAIRRNAEIQRETCRRYLAELVPRGRCDAVVEFAIKFPTEIFLGLMNLPLGDTDLLVRLVEEFFQGYSGAVPELAGRAYREIRDYFGARVDERVAVAQDVESDILSALLASTIADDDTGEQRPLLREEILDMCFLLVIAGLDTTRAQIGWMLYHFATHPEDRRRVLRSPELIPSAVEEVLRFYTIIYGDGRKVTQDADYHGCPLKKGDMVYGMTSAANRDRKYEDPDTFVLDRRPMPNLAFAAGAHRCLGSHLARSEMQVALAEWLAAIPEYRVDTDEPLGERGAQLSLVSLPLAWPVTAPSVDGAMP